MQQEEPGGGGPLAPLDFRKIAPIEAAAASDRLGWGHLLHVKGSYRITAPRLVLSHHLRLPDESDRWHQLAVNCSAGPAARLGTPGPGT